jgi:hypothetical protein
MIILFYLLLIFMEKGESTHWAGFQEVGCQRISSRSGWFTLLESKLLQKTNPNAASCRVIVFGANSASNFLVFLAFPAQQTHEPRPR